MSFTDLNLDEQLLRAIQACGFTSPSDIQKQAIPVALEGHDLMASAQTGTGKTAAFVLPALQRLLNNEPAPGHGPRVLILTPTRELATQVTDAIRDLGKFSRLRSTTVVGGMPYPPQIKMLRQPLDLLVATPGRLIDHFESGRLDFGRLEMLVLDEADRMLDMGFVDDVERIAAALPEQRQTLLFSATLEGEVRNVARRLLKEPQRIQIAGVKTNHDSID
ncbi:MAG: DEAD/DEAH box helicase, partial [Gammaproteobacteria bacterium]|nr:DEAD/DEAH box helicase [Gammaproteobacteria bacterium]